LAAVACADVKERLRTTSGAAKASESSVKGRRAPSTTPLESTDMPVPVSAPPDIDMPSFEVPVKGGPQFMRPVKRKRSVLQAPSKLWLRGGVRPTYKLCQS
jgi:hypothetical protein